MANFNYARTRAGSSPASGDGSSAPPSLAAHRRSVNPLHSVGGSPAAESVPCSSESRARRCRRIASGYRDKAYECLSRARKARADGNLALMSGFLSEAQAWIEFAATWVERAVEAEESTEGTPS